MSLFVNSSNFRRADAGLSVTHPALAKAEYLFIRYEVSLGLFGIDGRKMSLP
jgi:hypothetical protein